MLDQWLANIEANPEQSVAENKPADADDSCFATNGTLLARGDDVWNGILDDGPNGACTDVFPLDSSSRIVSGGPIEATGVCDYSKPDAGRPRELRRNSHGDDD